MQKRKCHSHPNGAWGGYCTPSRSDEFNWNSGGFFDGVINDCEDRRKKAEKRKMDEAEFVREYKMHTPLLNCMLGKDILDNEPDSNKFEIKNSDLNQLALDLANGIKDETRDAINTIYALRAGCDYVLNNADAQNEGSLNTCLDEIKLLKRLREVLGSTRWEDSNYRISADALFAGASGYAESLLSANFAINQQDAYDSKVSIIQAWAARNGFRRPYKCHPYECVFFEYRIGEMKCRIKFQIVIPTSGAELKVMFFNNDYDKGRVGVNEFPELTEKFRKLFPRVDGEGPQYITSLAGNYNSERELLRFLDGKIKPFVIAYDRWFDAAKQTISLG